MIHSRGKYKFLSIPVRLPEVAPVNLSTMKIILRHPGLLLLSFSLLVISGRAFGGFYLVYILNALPHGYLYAIAAILGFALLLFAQIRYGSRIQTAGSVLHLAGAFCLLLSLFLFFVMDTTNYNHGTLRETVPVILLVVFLMLVVTYTGMHLLRLWRALRL